MSISNLMRKFYLIIFILYIIIAGFYQYNVLKGFKSLPSPIFGGDYYYQQGAITHIREGGRILESSSFQGGQSGYLPVYSFLCAKFSDLLKLETMEGMFLFSLFLFIIASFVWYAAGKVIFKDVFLGILTSLIGGSLGVFVILKYTHFSFYVMFPLFLLLFYKIYEDDSKIVESHVHTYGSKSIYEIPSHVSTRGGIPITETTIHTDAHPWISGIGINFVFLGVLIGLSALSHGILFIGSLLIFHFYLISLLIKIILKKKSGSSIRDVLRKWLIFIIFMLPLALLYWWKPIFVYHLKSTNDIVHWAGGNLGDFRKGFKFLYDNLSEYFFSFVSWYEILISILFTAGFIKVCVNTEKEKTAYFLRFLFIASFLVTFSYFFTEPVFKMNLIPRYCAYFFLRGVRVLIIVYMVYFLIKKKIIVSGFFKTFIILLFCAYNLLAFKTVINSKGEGIFSPLSGRNSLPFHLISLQEYIFKNTSLEDVFLSTKNLSFAVNGLTGRKLVTNRWPHQNDPYQDFSLRDAATAVILYGSNDSQRLRLIKEYKVKYLYWEDDWLYTLYDFDKNGQIREILSPFLCVYSPELQKMLDENGVPYLKTKFWIDSSLEGYSYPQYDLLVILPFFRRDNGSINIWSDSLNKYLKEVWFVKGDSGKKEAVLYKVVLDGV